MKKASKHISDSISFLSGNFTQLLLSTYPLLLLIALMHTLLPLTDIIPFVILQAVVFTLHATRNEEGNISRFKMKALYLLSIRNLAKWLAPKRVFTGVKYVFSHFASYLGMALLSILFFGFIMFMLCQSELLVTVIRQVAQMAAAEGDVIDIPANAGMWFIILSFVVGLLLAVLDIIILLPLYYRTLQCREDDASKPKPLPMI